MLRDAELSDGDFDQEPPTLKRARQAIVVLRSREMATRDAEDLVTLEESKFSSAA